MAQETWRYKNIFPCSAPVTRLCTANVGRLTAGEQVLFAVLQGLVNRQEPRIYLTFKECDRFWLDYYRTEFGITIEPARRPYALLKQNRDVVKGVVIFDPRIRATLNLAVMLCGRENCLPVTAADRERLAVDYDWADEVVHDLRDRFANDYEAYEWAFEHLFKASHSHILVKQPPAPKLCDYIVAHNLFVFDLSVSLKNRKERGLSDRIYQAMSRPCYQLGWCNPRDAEVEHVARPAKHGVFNTCSSSMPNLTVHAGIEVKPRYRPRRLAASRKKAGKKVYVTMTVSDGDALWCMNDRFRGHFAGKGRESIPLNWELQMLAYHQMPGMLHYYFKEMGRNGFPVASLSGAGYTYPNLHPDPASYLRYSQKYLEMTGMNFVYGGTQDPYHSWYWCEHESQDYTDLCRKHLPAAIGFQRNYGAWGIPEKQFTERGKKPFFCSAIYVNARRDIAAEVSRAAALVPARPLFLTLHVREDCTVRKLVSEYGKLQRQGCEVITMDVFVAKLRDAQEHGWIGDGIYPNREEINASLPSRFRSEWKRISRMARSFLKLADLPNNEIEKQFQDVPQFWECLPHNEKTRTVTTLEDDFAFSVLYVAQVLARLFFYGQGRFLTELTQGRDALRGYREGIPNIEVLSECIEHYLTFEQKPLGLATSKELARRLLRLLPHLDRAWGRQQGTSFFHPVNPVYPV